MLLLLLSGATLSASLAEQVGIAYPPSALFVIASFFILVVLLHYSTVISELSERNVTLAQRLAILEERQAAARAERC